MKIMTSAIQLSYNTLANFCVVSFYEFWVRFTQTMVFVYLEDVHNIESTRCNTRMGYGRGGPYISYDTNFQNPFWQHCLQSCWILDGWVISPFLFLNHCLTCQQQHAEFLFILDFLYIFLNLYTFPFNGKFSCRGGLNIASYKEGKDRKTPWY